MYILLLTGKTRKKHFGRNTFKSEAYYPQRRRNHIRRNYLKKPEQSIFHEIQTKVKNRRRIFKQKLKEYRQKRRRKSRLHRP